jgi:hypothetical protein
MDRGIFCVAFGLVLLAAGTVQPRSPSVDQIVARHVEALGGVTAILAVHSFVRHGWYREGAFHLDDTYVAQMRPFYRVIGSPEHELNEIHEGYDGAAWEYYPDPGIVLRTGGEAARATRHTAMFDDALVTYRADGTILTYGGTQRFLGHDVYVLHGILADGFHEDYFVDAKTFLIDGRSEVVPMHAYGQRYHTYDVFGDYRAEGGVMMSHSFKEVDSATGKVLDSGGDNTIDINPNLARSIFSPPQWNRSPIQEMIGRIYDERDDAHAAVWTYQQFRAIPEVAAAPTADAVDFVGYQCLKMGHTDTAIALLTLNVRDNPHSARAHFGLGRAFEAAGNRESAAREYRAALSIDPTFTRARTALDALR